MRKSAYSPRDPTSLSGARSGAQLQSIPIFHQLGCIPPKDLLKPPKFWETHFGNCWVKKKKKVPLVPFINALTTFSESPRFTAYAFAKPFPTVPSLAFPSLPFRFHRKKKSDSNSLVAQQPVSRAQSPHQGPHASRPAKPRTSAPSPPGTCGSTAASRPGPRSRITRPGSLPAPGRRASPPHRRGRRARRMRAALPGVPATLPPPTPRACHFLPSPHLRPGSVSRSLSQPASLCFPLPTRSAAAAQALRGGADRERERLT